MALRVNTLPGLRLVSSAVEAGALAGRRLPQALLVYLAVERSAPRDTLLALHWPERDQERARHSLSQALHELRSKLGEDCIGGAGDVVAIGAEVETDLGRFEAAVEGGRWAEALELYGGDFLDGAHLAPTHAFEEWLDRRRAQLARLHRRARRELVAERLAASDLAGALAVAERWAEVAPLDDEAQLRTVELLARTGRRSEALAHYERFRELLRADELEPMPELVQLAEDIGAGRVQPDAVTAADATAPAESAPPAAAPSPAVAAAAPGVGAPASVRRRLNRDLLTGAVVGVLVGAPCALLAAALLRAVVPGLAPPALPGRAILLAALLAVAAAGMLLLTRGAQEAGGAGRRPARGLGAGVGFALGVLAALSLAYTLAPVSPASMAVADKRGRMLPLVAITRFANRTGDPALEPIGRMAEEWVTRRLRSIPEVKVVADVPAAAADTSARAVAEVVRRTGADAVLFGSYYREGTDVLLVARVVPAEALRASLREAEELALQPIGPVRAPRDRPLVGVERLAAMVAGALASGCRSPECAPGRRPPTYEARVAWLEALAANTARGDVEASREGFRRAIALDSAFANAYTGLANSYLLAGMCPQVDSIGEVLEGRQADFSVYDLLYMRAMRATCRGDPEAAYQYRAEALHIGPENPGARWGAAEAAAAAGRLAQAERLLAGMADTWYRDELYYYTLYTAVLHAEGKIDQELRLADSARARLPATAYGYELGYRGLAAKGDTATLEARLAEARRGPRRTVPLADLFAKVAIELEWHGHAAEARRFATRALEQTERGTPAERGSPQYRLRRGMLLLQLGRWRDARPLLDGLASAEVAQLERRNELSPALLLASRGLLAAKLGDSAAARAALAATDGLPARTGLATRDTPRELCAAAILAALGDKPEALRRLADGQARGMLPRSSPQIPHTQLLLRDLWHDPEFDRLFAPRD